MAKPDRPPFRSRLTGTRELPTAQLISTRLIRDNPQQPRTGPLDVDDFAESIRTVGVLQPVVVMPAPTEDGDSAPAAYTLVAGHRRLAAVRLLHKQASDDGERARWEVIPSIVRPAEDSQLLALALIENLAREDLSAPDVMRALCLLRDTQGWSLSQTAQATGRSRGWISKYLTVADDPALRALVETEDVPISTAYEVASSAPEYRDAAVSAARSGRPQYAVRAIGHGTEPQVFRYETPVLPPPHEDEAGEGVFRYETPPAATAPATPGVRKLSDLARALGLRTSVNPNAQLIRILWDLFEKRTTDFVTGDYLDALREEMARVEGQIRSAM